MAPSKFVVISSFGHENIAILKLFPGISKPVVKCILNTHGLKAVILETVHQRIRIAPESSRAIR